MRTDFFADIAKNEGKTGKTGKTAEIVNKNNAIATYPHLTQPGKNRVRRVRSADEETPPTSNLTHLTQPGKNRVRRPDNENTNTYSNLASVLPILPNLPEKTDNFAISRADEVFDGGLSRQEAAAATVSTAPASPAPVETSPAITAPLPTRTEPPEPGSTAPFNQEALDAIKAGSGCWVWSGVLNEWLFVVRDEERKAKAIRRGIDAGAIWTLAEVTGVQGMPPEGLRDVAKIKRQFGGTVQPGEVPARWRDALQPLEPAAAEEQDANNQIVDGRRVA